MAVLHGAADGQRLGVIGDIGKAAVGGEGQGSLGGDERNADGAASDRNDGERVVVGIGVQAGTADHIAGDARIFIDRRRIIHRDRHIIDIDIDRLRGGGGEG